MRCGRKRTRDGATLTRRASARHYALWPPRKDGAGRLFQANSVILSARAGQLHSAKAKALPRSQPAVCLRLARLGQEAPVRRLAFRLLG